MKTIDQVIKGYKSDTLDGRDLNRLADFVPESRLSELGLSMKPEHKGKHTTKPLTEENVIKQMKKDVAFGFEKALNQRGISSSLMKSVVDMWLWVLDDTEFEDLSYAMYGLPTFKSVAVKYGFDNPIGDDSGSEDKYGE